MNTRIGEVIVTTDDWIIVVCLGVTFISLAAMVWWRYMGDDDERG